MTTEPRHAGETRELRTVNYTPRRLAQGELPDPEPRPTPLSVRRRVVAHLYAMEPRTQVLLGMALTIVIVALAAMAVAWVFGKAGVVA